MCVHSRVLKIDIDKFQLDLTSRTSDLRNENRTFGLLLDTYYDQEAEDMDKQTSKTNDKNKNRTCE